LKKVVDGFPVLSIEGIIKPKWPRSKKDLNDIADLKLFADWLKKEGWKGGERPLLRR
jgi:hypothetical protein